MNKSRFTWLLVGILVLGLGLFLMQRRNSGTEKSAYEAPGRSTQSNAESAVNPGPVELRNCEVENRSKSLDTCPSIVNDLLTEMELLRARVSQLEVSLEAGKASSDLTSRRERSRQEIALDEEALTDQEAVAVAERRFSLDERFYAEVGGNDTWSGDLNERLQDAMTTNDELKMVFKHAECAPTLCRLELQPDANAVSTVRSLRQVLPEISEFSSKSVILRGENGETTVYVMRKGYED